MKNSNDTSWDRISDFRLVAQHLNHCATAAEGKLQLKIPRRIWEDIETNLKETGCEVVGWIH